MNTRPHRCSLPTLVALLLILAPACGAGPAGRGAHSEPAADAFRADVARVQRGVEEWKQRGKDPKPVFALMKDVEKLYRSGRRDEATDRVERALALLGRDANEAAPVRFPTHAPQAEDTWRHVGPLPVIDLLDPPRGLASDVLGRPLQNWNDPSVLREAGGFSMWASLGLEGGGKNVSIYKLSSRDGLEWRVANAGRPVLRPGKRSEFDWYGVETPVVIRSGTTYHMYYTAYHEPNPNKGGHQYTMGHATSRDGVHWKRHGELTSLCEVVGHRRGNPWGWLARAEPAVVQHGGLFYLYFTDVRCRRDDCRGPTAAVRGISLATSRDGHRFEQRGSEPVLLQTASYPASEGWSGYSTPWVYHDGRWFHLYVDVFRSVEGTEIQRRIAHYRSRDGHHFDEVETDVVRAEGHPWATISVRAPTVVETGGEHWMWYAGDSFDPVRQNRGQILADLRSGKLRMGIGLVRR